MKFVSLLSRPFSRLVLGASVALMVSLSACQPEDVIAEEDQEIAIEEAEVEATFEDAEAYTFEAMDITDFSSYRRNYQSALQRLINSCATVTHDSINKTITVDFGTGCTGPDGKVRSGQIVITYTARMYLPGSVTTVSLVNYVVDSVSIAGTRTYTNVSATLQDPISLQVTLTGGQVTFPDGTTATRAFTRTSTWIRAANPANDELQVVGNASGTRISGQSYTATITSMLIFKRTCRIQGQRVPVQGTVLVQRPGKPDVTLDFGNGTCDALATVTVNGNTRTISLRNR